MRKKPRVNEVIFGPRVKECYHRNHATAIIIEMSFPLGSRAYPRAWRPVGGGDDGIQARTLSPQDDLRPERSLQTLTKNTLEGALIPSGLRC